MTASALFDRANLTDQLFKFDLWVEFFRCSLKQSGKFIRSINFVMDLTLWTETAHFSRFRSEKIIYLWNKINRHF
jgi:hypothetical protein